MFFVARLLLAIRRVFSVAELVEFLLHRPQQFGVRLVAAGFDLLEIVLADGDKGACAAQVECGRADTIVRSS